MSLPQASININTTTTDFPIMSPRTTTSAAPQGDMGPFENVLALRVVPTSQVIRISSLSRMLQVLNHIMSEREDSTVQLKKVTSPVYPNYYELSYSEEKASKSLVHFCLQLQSLFHTVDEATLQMSSSVNDMIDQFAHLLDNTGSSAQNPVKEETEEIYKSAVVVPRAFRMHSNQKQKKRASTDPKVQCIQDMGFDICEEELVSMLKRERGNVAKVVNRIVMKEEK